MRVITLSLFTAMSAVAAAPVAAQIQDAVSIEGTRLEIMATGESTQVPDLVIINAGVVMGVLPTKGLTLPFLSYGRTSLVVCCGAVGLLLGIARREASTPAPVISGATSRGLAWD